MENFATVELKDVVGVYSGKDGMCCCGCAGTYSYAEEHRAKAGKNRGYDVVDEEVKEHNVKRVFNLFKKNLASVDHLTKGHFTLVVGKRLYMLFTKDWK